ncbi:hypothetical protein [Aureimonas sp. AU12]|uniref:hypothetical protein n=1 Tax=Aureimonas sp. AU12 TaxID=1638161 RepID=UPI0007864098|nr:hypothetical protein [Aureimonas sp. AU12]
MIYLIEIEAADEATGALTTLRFASRAYTTRPDDEPANAVFRSRLKDPGNYERYLFGQGRTFGESEVGAGEVVLVNTDGALDFMLDLAFDGRALRIYSLKRVNSAWSSRETVLIATMEQASFNGREVAIRLRDRLELLRDPIQSAVYLGTTTEGGRADAEGNSDLKDTKKPMLFGRVLNVAPVLVDQFDNIYQVSANPLAAVTAVTTARDTGVKLSAAGDFPSLAALKAAPIPQGHYGTCLASGLVRTYARPNGTMTVDANEGATLADRSAARIVRRIIGAIGAVSEADFEALHAANPAECGIFIAPSETTTLAVASTILASIGGFLSVDLLGVFRVGRLLLPSGPPEARLIRNRIIDRGEGFARLPTNDPGDGVPAWKITVRYGRNYTVFSESDLKEVATDDAFRTFATLEWRQVIVEDAAVKQRHPKASELVFETCLLNEADARSFAAHLLAIYSKRRDLFRVVQPSATVAGVDPNDVVELAIDRYGFGAGKLVRVLGVVPTFSTNLTELEVWL